MSLYELESMIRSLPKFDDKPKSMTQERMNELKTVWAGLNLPDVKVH